MSIVCPAYNEKKNLAILIAEMDHVLPQLADYCQDLEWIIADDGSTDNLSQLISHAPTYIKHLALDHRGMSAALYDGVMAATGEIIATMDADLQHDPTDLPAMLETLVSQQADMVCGIRCNRQDSRSKRLASGISNRVRRLVLGDTIQDAGCTLRVFKSSARGQCFWPFQGSHRFVGPFAQRQGLKVVQVEVNHRTRQKGSSHFGIGDRLPKVMWDLVGAKWLMSRTIKPSIENKREGQTLQNSKQGRVDLSEEQG